MSSNSEAESKQGHVDNTTTDCDVMEPDLVDEDRLAGSRVARDEIDSAAKEATRQHGVDAGTAAGDAFNWAGRAGEIGHRRVLLVTPEG